MFHPLTSHTRQTHHYRFFLFCSGISLQSHHNKFLISYDIESLYTNIPLIETIDIALDLIFGNNPNFPIQRKDLRELFLTATSHTHFFLTICSTTS